MARKQAKKRKQKAVPKVRLPKIPFARIAGVCAATLVIFLSYELSASLLDRPIRAITIDAPFQRVSALQIEEAISGELEHGFLSANLTVMQKRIVALPWIDQANVARRWPDTLEITVAEQIPAACWGERGLLNTRGELFVRNARHVPAELPRLSGPPDRSAEVAQRYLDVRDNLIPLGLDVRRVHLDARGAWDMTLSNGVAVRLGRREVTERTELFLDVVANIVSSREAEIEFVDMRYSNGFTIGWKGDAPPVLEEPESARPEMVAGRTD
ncbi:MAG TPA: cell division protein FtsQ/DivIB [Woeseiaceae bacterium]|nr:cell division protein FtsQ/DivIB [Woeseiaceae bacterium]